MGLKEGQDFEFRIVEKLTVTAPYDVAEGHQFDAVVGDNTVSSTKARPFSRVFDY